MLMRARFNDVSRYKQSSLVFQYYAGTVNAHTRVSRRPRDPPRIMDVLRDAQWRTNTPGLPVLSARQLVHMQSREDPAHVAAAI